MSHNMNTFYLSILICTLPEREHLLNRVLDQLNAQMMVGVEILTDDSPRGVPVGEKRNSLLERAQGAYCVFVDDDDEVTGDYIPSIMSAIESGPDCVGIEGFIDIDGDKRVFRHSIEFAGWYTGADAYYRTPNHLNPIRTEIARKAGFPRDVSFGEDQAYSSRIRKYLKTEVYIDKPIYIYHASKCGWSAMER